MTQGNFADMQEVALELIEENGEKATLNTRTDAAPPDPAKPHEPGAPVVVPTTVDAVFLPSNKPTAAREPGTLLKKQVQLAYLVGTITTPPTVGCSQIVRVNEEIWDVTAIVHYQPNEDSILYILEVAR